jgi:SAM-dependent methyltransferase
VFNNLTGAELSLESFVRTGDAEVDVYVDRFGWAGDASRMSLLEIGSGIGRMTAGFTRRFASVTATDVDAAFLERCRETVARFGNPAVLRTVHIADGNSIPVADHSVDAVFSYIVMQHCKASDALRLTRESLRVLKPGGWLALNFRTWVPEDIALVPAGAVVRLLWHAPFVGPRLSRWRWSTRLGWQANRLDPRRVLATVEASGVEFESMVVLHHPGRPQRDARFRDAEVSQRDLDVANKSHWWLLAQRR